MSRTPEFIALSAILILVSLVPGVLGITVPLGDTVPLSGAAPGADTVYLFLTGPNLPSNGVRLDDITAEVVTGVPSTFTQAPVSNGQWEYTWYTGSTGGTLDAGTYTVYVSTTPVGRNDLSRAVYSSISITLTLPTIEVPLTGTLVVESVPAGAGVVVDGVLQGTSPVELTGVPAGQHIVVLSLTGYTNSTNTVTVVAGETTSVNVALVPVSPQPTSTVSASLETSPPTSSPGTSPTPAPLSLAAIAGALGGALSLLLLRSRTHRDEP